MTDDQTPAPEPASQPEPEQAPAEQAPAEQAPAEQAPAEQAPAEQAPAEQAPAEQAPAEQAPAEQAPAEQAPAPRPAVPRPSAPRPHAPRPTAPAPAAPTSDPSAFGRVSDDGTVFVRTSDGEREVGSYPGASADEALAYFGRKYDEIVAQVDLFEQRLSTADVPASEIESGVAKLRAAAADAHAVGDLAALHARIEALAPALAARREHDEHARSAAREEAKTRRTALVEEAEAIAAVPAERTQWRADGLRMKQLFEQWRTEQKSAGRGPGHGAAGTEPAPARLDRRSEDELWKRFSHARTAFDRKRRQHFAHLDEQHEEARETKERLVKEAEALQSSTDWGPTAAAFKRLMDRWRAAGRAARKDDDELWTRFSAAQDAFFSARHAVQAEQDAEFGANLATKEALLLEAEKLVPVTDLTEARARLRDIQDRWEAAGHVPRGDMDRIERRMRAVEQTVRSAEDDRWKNTNPEARARAQSAVDQLEVVISDLHEQIAKAEAGGKTAKVAELEASLEAREQWLEQARGALADFGA